MATGLLWNRGDPGTRLPLHPVVQDQRADRGDRLHAHRARVAPLVPPGLQSRAAPLWGCTSAHQRRAGGRSAAHGRSSRM